MARVEKKGWELGWGFAWLIGFIELRDGETKTSLDCRLGYLDLPSYSCVRFPFWLSGVLTRSLAM